MSNPNLKPIYKSLRFQRATSALWRALWLMDNGGSVNDCLDN